MAASSEAKLSWGSDGSMFDWEAFRELTCCAVDENLHVGREARASRSRGRLGDDRGPVDGVLADVVAVLAGGVLAAVVAVLAGGVLAGVVAVLGRLRAAGRNIGDRSRGHRARNPWGRLQGGNGDRGGGEAAAGAGLEVAEGIRAAALGISSLPIVRPVTGS